MTSCSVMRHPTVAASNGVQLCVLSLGLGCPHQVLLTSFLFRVDHLRSVELCASALQVACHLLASRCQGSSASGGGAASGTFVTKLWAGGEQQPLLADMRSRYSPFPSLNFSSHAHARAHLRALPLISCPIYSFATVKPCKPPASRPESVEMFFVCQGFKRETSS